MFSKFTTTNAFLTEMFHQRHNSNIQHQVFEDSVATRCNQIENLEPLTNLKNLQILNLSFNNIRDVSPLNKLGNLKIVHLVENPVNNWNSVTSLNEPGRNTKVIKYVESSMLTQEYLVRFFSKGCIEMFLILNFFSSR